MKLIHQNLRHGEIKLVAENNDDLWYLSQLIDENDFIKGRTIRKIKLGNKDQRNIKIIKKPVFIKLKVKKLELSENSLRILGTIIEATDEIPHGQHHSFNIEPNTRFTIIKEHWLKFQLNKLKEACSKEGPKILIAIMDREEAYFALMKKYNYKFLSHIAGNVRKKAEEGKPKENFYEQIISSLKEYDKRYSLSKIILASPAFWKEELLKTLKDNEIRNKIIQATCSSVDKNAINEVLKRPETRQALKEDRISKETIVVEELLTEISKSAAAAYGIKEVENAANAGAVKTLLVTDKLIRKARTNNTYKQLENIMKTVEATKGHVHLISSEHDAGKKLDGLGGIGAILRYKLNY